MAGKFSSLAFRISFSSWAAPSRRLYSEWTCRWTKSARGFIDAIGLLPFDRAGGLGRDVEHHPVDAADLVDDPRGDPAEEVVGQPRPVRRHRVLAHHGSERDH